LKQRPTKLILFALLLLIGAALLLYKFPSVPVGLHQDEMSEAYESYCLLHTGADRWGYHLPVYFVGWGSGQNVLQAYLTIPVVAVLGLTRVSARLVPVLCGLLTLPLFFFTLRRWFGENTALIGLFFLVFTPWHIMFSRWGVENSPLPFFMLLGIFTFGRALHSRALHGRSYWTILPCLLPFALALYTYGLVAVILPVLLPLLFLIDPRAILKRWGAWLGAFALFFVASSPIVFFTVKNYITKTNYGFERWLPFTVPLLPVTRLDQIHQESAQQQQMSRLDHNLLFLRYGLADHFRWKWIDHYPWNQVNHIAPVPPIVLLLAVVGAVYLLITAVRKLQFSEPFLPSAIACVPLFFIMPMDMSRCSALYLPLIALGAASAGMLLARVKLRPYGLLLAAACLMLLAVPTARFVRRYYGPVYAGEIAPAFYPELPDAFARTLQVAGTSMPIYVSEDILLNYVDVLFLTRTDPSVFQHSGATWDHPDFGRYRFQQASLANTPRPFAFLLKDYEAPVCDAPADTERDGQFVIGICR
jgi:4-amino-4-deoxy-L-arabinose transferase-like glycosyltransferase